MESTATAASNGIHIALAAEQITEFFGIPITNTLITSWVVIALLIGVSLLLRGRLSEVPGKIQLLFECVIEFILDYIEQTLGSRRLALRYFPLLTTLFLFIFISNILEFMPGIGSIGFFETANNVHAAPESGESFIPLFRSVNTDLNVTLALTLIVFAVIELSGIVLLGFFKYFSRFFNFHSPMDFFIGIIEFFSEIARLVSFSFRLFGNIFAGEVMIAVIAFFVPFVVPVPFMLFEIFVGFMQAAIFALLTLFFIKIAVMEVSH